MSYSVNCTGTSRIFCVDFENSNCVKTNKGRPTLSAAKMFSMDCRLCLFQGAVVTAQTDKFRIAWFGVLLHGFLVSITCFYRKNLLNILWYDFVQSIILSVKIIGCFCCILIIWGCFSGVNLWTILYIRKEMLNWQEHGFNIINSAWIFCALRLFQLYKRSEITRSIVPNDIAQSQTLQKVVGGRWW